MASLQERLYDKISPEPNSGCWLWTGACSRNGYARLGQAYAHRLIYEAEKGPIPAGLDIDHLCSVRCCVNPDHLEAVTRSENLRRRKRLNLRIVQPANRQLTYRNYCKRGHEMTEANTYSRKDRWGERECLACRNLRNDRRRPDPENVRHRGVDHTHCKHGHPYTPETIYISQGVKTCRVCAKQRMAKFNERRLAQGLPT